jgi:hypothetical protein
MGWQNKFQQDFIAISYCYCYKLLRNVHTTVPVGLGWVELDQVGLN